MANHPLLFSETYSIEGPSFFDDELDAWCRARVEAGTTLTGYCNVCARRCTFAVRSDNLREDLACSECGAISRHRQIVCALSSATFDHPSATLDDVCADHNDRHAPLYTAEANSALYRALSSRLAPGLVVGSEYFGDGFASGDLGPNDVVHQDLHATSFADGRFATVLTSEVFEHLPFPSRAEAEVVRILQPGGIYCFTVPFSPTAPQDIVLARQRDDGTIEHFGEPQYHGDPVRPEEGILVYQVFSHLGLSERFSALGCDYRTERFWSPQLGILGVNSFTMTARKPAPAPRGIRGRQPHSVA